MYHNPSKMDTIPHTNWDIIQRYLPSCDKCRDLYHLMQIDDTIMVWNPAATRTIPERLPFMTSSGRREVWFANSMIAYSEAIYPLSRLENNHKEIMNTYMSELSIAKPSIAKGLLHCTLGLCCPCVAISSCMSGARTMISTQQWKDEENSSSCRYCGAYNGLLFSMTMCVAGYEELRQSCCVPPPVQTDMAR